MALILWLTPVCAQLQPKLQADLVGVAHQSIRSQILGTPFVLKGQTPPKAVFVTIERDGIIRGCRGSLVPRNSSLESEVAAAARDAAAHDPRYRPVTAKELDRILVTITIVERQSPLGDIASLAPSEGLVLVSNNRTGVVLPWEGKDPGLRLKWAYKKAGVSQNSPARLTRLVAERFRG